MHSFLFAAVFILLAGCSGAPLQVAAPVQSTHEAYQARQHRFDQTLALFSASKPGRLTEPWTPMLLNRIKTPTRYQLVDDDGTIVLHASASNAASALMQQVEINTEQFPWLQWRWKAANLIRHADNTLSEVEDAPVRIMLAFDGDKSLLPFTDQIAFETSKLISGNELPYATLMYIWERNKPVDSFIANHRTGRIKMVVAASGSQGINQWQTLSRNIISDFEKAFGEKPGRLIGIGVMTDTDNTGETVEAWYGDIELKSAVR